MIFSRYSFIVRAEFLFSCIFWNDSYARPIASSYSFAQVAIASFFARPFFDRNSLCMTSATVPIACSKSFCTRSLLAMTASMLGSIQVSSFTYLHMSANLNSSAASSISALSFGLCTRETNSSISS